MAKRTGNGRRREDIATAPDRRTTPPSESFSSRTFLSMAQSALTFQDLLALVLFETEAVRDHKGRATHHPPLLRAPSNPPIASKMPGERRPVGGALIEERISSFGGLLGHIGQSRGLTGEELLADKTIIHQVERKFEHALCRGTLA